MPDNSAALRKRGAFAYQIGARSSSGVLRCSELKIIHVLRGATTLHTDPGDLHLEEGTVTVVPAGIQHIGTPSATGVELISVLIDTDFVTAQATWMPISRPFLDQLMRLTAPSLLTPSRRRRSRLQRNFLDLASIPRVTPEEELTWYAALADTLALLSSAHTPARQVQQGNSTIRAVIDLIETNLHEPWTVACVARYAALSPSQLTRLFVVHTGHTPWQYIRRARAYEMRRLLMETDLNVKQAASAVGWRNPSHASRTYRAVFGSTPAGRYRDTTHGLRVPQRSADQGVPHFSGDAAAVTRGVGEWFDTCGCNGAFTDSDRASDCEVLTGSSEEKAKGGSHAVEQEFRSGPPADEHAQVEPSSVAELGGTVAGNADGEVDGAKQDRGHSPSVSAASAEKRNEAVTGEPALAPGVDGGSGSHCE